MRLRPSDYAVEIKQRLTMNDVLNRYVFPYEPKGSRIPCPIHNGADYNFSFNKGGFHCFVCGASGDVIGFMQQYFNMSFSEAIRRLDEDFSLNLPIDGDTSHYDTERKKELRTQAALRELNNALRKQSADELDAEYWVLLRVYKIYCEAVERLKPSNPEEEPTKEFLHVLKYRDIAENKLDDAFDRICSERGEMIDRLNAG